MDGGIFGAVTRLGRDAAKAVARAVHGDTWDPFLSARCFDVLLSEANGLPSLPGVLREVRTPHESPLFASTLVQDSLDRIGDAVRNANGTVLDLVLRSAAERCVLRGEYEPRRVLERFCLEVLDGAIISGRGGFLELEHGGHARRSEALAVLAEVARAAASILISRSDTKRLGLARRHAQLGPDTNLLGGGVYQRYATEIMTLFERARPALANRPHLPRKENERDLFAAVG